MKCRACMMGVVGVLVAWVVSVPVRGAKAMFAGTNVACAHNGDGFSYTEVDGMRRADTTLAVVPTSHALSSAATPIIYKECQRQDNAAFRAVGERVVAAYSATPIIYKECHGQGNVAFRTVGERVVAAYSATPIIYKEYHGQDNAAFSAIGERVVAACADTPIIYIGSQIQSSGLAVGGVGGLVTPRSLPELGLSKRVENKNATRNSARVPAPSTLLSPYHAPWISAPQPDSTAMQWFLRTYKHNGRPRKAYVSVATTGKTQLLVNGMNVSRNLFEPHRAQGDTSVVNIVYDVTPFLSPNANTISLWYCPTMPHVGRRQVAVCYWGENADGTPFAFQSDENWACRRANRGLQPPESEWQDGNDKALPWQVNLADTISWQSPVCYAHPETLPPATPLRLVRAPRVVKVFGPSYVDVRNDTLTYVFPHHFQGVVRITFRGTRTGEKVYINGFRYICNGATDEQFFCKFIVKPAFKLIVHGDKYFRSEQVQNVEALETSIVLYEKFLF